MKKYFFLLLLPFIFFNNVYADDEPVYYCSSSANKIITGNFISGYHNPFGTSKPSAFYCSYSYNGVVEVQENTSYSFKFMSSVSSSSPQRVSFMYYDSNKEYLSFTSPRVSNDTNFFTNIITPSNTKYIYFCLYNVWSSSVNTSTSVLYEGSEYNTNNSITSPIIEYQQCPADNPVDPSDNVYSDFISLYLNRITYLANGFTTNPYLLAMIGIIFSFIVLEIFLRIFHLRGGYRK